MDSWETWRDIYEGWEGDKGHLIVICCYMSLIILNLGQGSHYMGSGYSNEDEALYCDPITES